MADEVKVTTFENTKRLSKNSNFV